MSFLQELTVLNLTEAEEFTTIDGLSILRVTTRWGIFLIEKERTCTKCTQLRIVNSNYCPYHQVIQSLTVFKGMR